MYKHKKITSYKFSIEDDTAAITIIKPSSGELSQFGKYIVLYENAFGNLELKTLTIEEIAIKYEIDKKCLENVL